jgi:hypothetical protein
LEKLTASVIWAYPIAPGIELTRWSSVVVSLTSHRITCEDGSSF